MLRHEGELVAQVGQPVFAQIDAVEKNLTRRGIVKAQQQADQRSLAGARLSGNSCPSPRGDLERNRVQHRTVGAVVEGDVPERQGARGARQRPRVGPFDHLRRLVEQRKGSLGASQVRLQGGRLPGHSFQGIIELRQIAHQQQ